MAGHRAQGLGFIHASASGGGRGSGGSALAAARGGRKRFERVPRAAGGTAPLPLGEVGAAVATDESLFIAGHGQLPSGQGARG
ncbi:hypothetical protein MAIT1_01407 [Magnetofaba australis IT-1]|uniref:Uncharacterized protein n=1 Tax=Magnetofaba australis IT-1 TaxID=1434232 RepID=A0A1Y2K2N1_9PROT|nr:hypothetical protein MAIT1_01407 [Magnetofaba australis IT-1]